jgi:CheY-like chemotaxis protein
MNSATGPTTYSSLYVKAVEHLRRGSHLLCPTILLVDDNPADIDLLQMAFAQNGFTGRLLIAGNGRDAMGIADEVCRGLVPCPDLVVLDVNMPIFSGFDVLQRLRASPIGCDVPVAMLTSTTQASEKETAARLGATCFLEKPMTLEGYASVADDLERLIPTKCMARG